MPWIKSGVSGFLGALVMVALMKLAIAQGIAPFSIPPSAAFLTQLGLSNQILALVTHFSYGIFWSIVLVAIFWDRTSLGKGIGLSVALWLFMMLVYSPIIGWGFFGMNPVDNLPANLQLTSGIKYIVSTLVLHLIYGSIIGWINANWITYGMEVAEEIRTERKKDEI